MDIMQLSVDESNIRAVLNEFISSKPKPQRDSDPDKQKLYDIINDIYSLYDPDVSSRVDIITLKNVISIVYKLVYKQLTNTDRLINQTIRYPQVISYEDRLIIQRISTQFNNHDLFVIRHLPFVNGRLSEYSIKLSDFRVGDIIEFQNIIFCHMSGGNRSDYTLANNLIEFFEVLIQNILENITSVFNHKSINLIILDCLYQYH
jgi:hypothetical protein